MTPEAPCRQKYDSTSMGVICLVFRHSWTPAAEAPDPHDADAPYVSRTAETHWCSSADAVANRRSSVSRTSISSPANRLAPARRSLPRNGPRGRQTDGRSPGPVFRNDPERWLPWIGPTQAMRQ
jgi:hypothetical protein